MQIVHSTVLRMPIRRRIRKIVQLLAAMFSSYSDHLMQVMVMVTFVSHVLCATLLARMQRQYSSPTTEQHVCQMYKVNVAALDPLAATHAVCTGVMNTLPLDLGQEPIQFEKVATNR